MRSAECGVRNAEGGVRIGQGGRRNAELSHADECSDAPKESGAPREVGIRIPRSAFHIPHSAFLIPSADSELSGIYAILRRNVVRIPNDRAAHFRRPKR